MCFARLSTKTCKNGHSMTIDNIDADGRCSSCRQSRQRSPEYLEKQYKMTQEWRINNRERYNECARKRQKIYREQGKRDYLYERAKAKGITKEEYILSRLPKHDAHVREHNVFIERLSIKHDSHVRLFSHTQEGKRFKWNKNRKQKVDSISNSYLAKLYGLSVAAHPVPLFELARQILTIRRYLRCQQTSKK